MRNTNPDWADEASNPVEDMRTMRNSILENIGLDNRSVDLLFAKIAYYQGNDALALELLKRWTKT